MFNCIEEMIGQKTKVYSPFFDEFISYTILNNKEKEAWIKQNSAVSDGIALYNPSISNFRSKNGIITYIGTDCWILFDNESFLLNAFNKLTFLETKAGMWKGIPNSTDDYKIDKLLKEHGMVFIDSLSNDLYAAVYLEKSKEYCLILLADGNIAFPKIIEYSIDSASPKYLFCNILNKEMI